MYLYFLCSLLLSSLTRQNKKERKKKARKSSPYTKFTGALSWKLIGLLTEMLKNNGSNGRIKYTQRSPLALILATI